MDGRVTRMAPGESSKLLGKDSIHVLGTEVQRNDRDWLYALVFPIRVPGENDEQFNEMVEDPNSKWKEIFPTEEEGPVAFRGSVSWEAFTRAARELVVKHMRDLGCEVKEFKSVDEDEIFVLLGLKDKESVKKFAQAEEALVRLKPSAYEGHGQCPTDKKVGHAFEKETMPHLTLQGKEHFNEFPAFVRYVPDLDEIVEEVEPTELLRCMRAAMRKTCRLNVMEEEGVLRLFFPIHKWDELEELYARGWSNPKAPFYFPKAHMPDSVAEYFGAHVASYFHFYNTFSRWLILPALLSVAFPLVRGQLHHRQAHYLDAGFGAMMCVWTTLFLAQNKQGMNKKLLKWGMGGNVNAVTMVRKNFKDEKRGSWSELARNLLHWLIVVCFLLETVFVSRWIVTHRQKVLSDLDGTTWGMSNKDLQFYFKYLVTANIKIVDFVFTPLSIYLSKHENHRTEMDLKDAMTLKLFAVKAVLFYYPFIRVIFIQPEVEGCPHDDFEGCLDNLRTDLQLFFITQVISAAAGLLVQVALMYWTIRKEVERKKSSDSILSYVEVQAMLKDYDEESEVSDYMQAVLNFGFLSMFGAVAPSMCLLCLLSNLPMKRLLAYRFSYTQKRVIPIITVGIGSWALILNFLAYLGVTCTTYIVIFAFNVFNLDSFSAQLLYFISFERGLAVLKFLIDLANGDKSLSQTRIEECNDDVRDIILANQLKRVHGQHRAGLFC